MIRHFDRETITEWDSFECHTCTGCKARSYGYSLLAEDAAGKKPSDIAVWPFRFAIHAEQSQICQTVSADTDPLLHCVRSLGNCSSQHNLSHAANFSITVIRNQWHQNSDRTNGRSLTYISRSSLEIRIGKYSLLIVNSAADLSCFMCLIAPEEYSYSFIAATAATTPTTYQYH